MIAILFVFATLYYIPTSFYNSTTKQYYSNELVLVKQKEGNIEKNIYIDSIGNIQFAIDKNYAYMVRTKNEDDNTVIEEYFTEKGEPVIQDSGHYALKRKYNENGQDIEITYLDKYGNPALNKMGYVIVKRRYNTKGKVEYERYYDKEGNCVKHRYEGYGRCYEYYEESGERAIIHLGYDDKPTLIDTGYSKVIQSFWKDGKVKTELYYDIDNQPISLELGQYGVYKEYDKNGRNCLITYLDKSGNPFINYLGYATVILTFNSDNTINTEMYYGIDGNSIQLSKGQSGVKIQDNTTVYLNENGKEKYELSNYLHNYPLCSVLCAVFIILLCSFERRINKLMLGLYVIFILYMTLLYREKGDAGINLNVFWSYSQFFQKKALKQEILNNIWLFIPLGCILYNVFSKPQYLIILIIFSIMIELLQLLLNIGLCEIDDIISNAIGGIVGYWTGYTLSKRRQLSSRA